MHFVSLYDYYFVHVHTAYLVSLIGTETQRDIHQRATDELADAGLEGLHLR